MIMDKKLFCGPMATISHTGFRLLVEKFGGVDEYFTEMINAASLVQNGPFEKYYVDSSPVPEKLIWQLTGHDSDYMEKAACILANTNAKGIDINMGCSAPNIYKFGSGISWMTKDINQTVDMVQKVKNQIVKNNPSMRLSVKLRLGDQDFTDQGFYKFCNILVENGVQLLTLHPRTKKEKLCRPARYSYCQELALIMKEKNVQVVLNGNIKDFDSYQKAITLCPDVYGVMIARMAVQKPWIFAMIKGKPLTIDLQELALEYIDLVEKYQPQEFYKTRLQRFFTYFCMNFKFAHYAQTQFLNAKDNEELRQRINDFFGKFPEEKILKINS